MIARITKNLYLSGANEVRNLDELKHLGIDAIVNVAQEESDPNYDVGEFLMVKIGLSEFTPNPRFLLSMAVLTLHNLIENGRTVLIHCHAGAHRSPYIAFLYLAEKEHRNIEAVYQEFVSVIPWGIVCPPQIKAE